MPDIDFAFLADAAETIPGQKFHVLGGGIARIGGRRFPLRHPHLALVIGLQVTAPETEREHDIRFVLLDPDGAEVAGATGSLVARSQRDGRDATLTFSIDLWNLTFPAPGDYSFRILVNGSERKRLPLLLLAPPDGVPVGARRRTGGCLTRTRTRGPARHEVPVDRRPGADRGSSWRPAPGGGARTASRALDGVPRSVARPSARRRAARPALGSGARPRSVRPQGLRPGRAAGRADRAVPRRDRPPDPRDEPGRRQGLRTPEPELARA